MRETLEEPQSSQPSEQNLPARESEPSRGNEDLRLSGAMLGREWRRSTAEAPRRGTPAEEVSTQQAPRSEPRVLRRPEYFLVAFRVLYDERFEYTVERAEDLRVEIEVRNPRRKDEVVFRQQSSVRQVAELLFRSEHCQFTARPDLTGQVRPATAVLFKYFEFLYHTGFRRTQSYFLSDQLSQVLLFDEKAGGFRLAEAKARKEIQQQKNTEAR